MRDPLAYINSAKILCSFPVRYKKDMKTWIQGVSINEERQEIYVANQENTGTVLRIDVRDLNGKLKSSKNIPIDSGSFTESLPYFYNKNDQLSFIVRPKNEESAAIFNYETGVLGSTFPIKGKAKSDVDGDYFVTSDVWTDTIKNIYIYTWESVKAGNPVLVNSIRTENYGRLTEKSQGIVVNNGYIFITQGAQKGKPAITVYNTAGQLVNSFIYTKSSLAKAVNSKFLGRLPDAVNYDYENEGGCKYKGRLSLAQIIDGECFIFVHNSPRGVALETEIPIYKVDTGYLNVTLLNGCKTYGADTVPRIRRIGNLVELNGALKNVSNLNTEYLEFPKELAPDRNIQMVQVTSSGYQCNWQVQPNGRVKIINTRNPNTGSGTWYPFMFHWSI
ncbi:hypothetical protein ACIGLI_07225 [Bacillus subtilis]|uniref:hypothetical protein n=1 Tax=Bacillus TaxID=1386 RepID=UPI000A089C66|nr:MULTISPECIES: hypothetical protein [Bacillus]MBJ3767382.1 hypothetical protein [Bacillus subtilis]MDI6682594.1 hypothetical protein [Bacillus subtilis]MEC2266567.1 hypothetical protein [Bacillus subtilis]MED3669919.1 hypothetical protein [Bacillus subtilis]MED4459917.1 hypothetical protein [Bacillus subtilis]